MAAPVRGGRERDIDALAREPAIQLGALQLGGAGFDSSFERAARRVERHPRLAIAYVAQRELECALAPQVVDAYLLDLVDGRRGGDRGEGLLLERLHVHRDARVPRTGDGLPASPASIAGMGSYDAFASIYDDWSATMTEDVAFYVELAREADGPVVELAVGNGRVAVPVAEAIGRPVIGIDASPAMLAGARERAAAAGVELDLRQGDMRELSLDEPAGPRLLPVPLAVAPAHVA